MAYDTKVLFKKAQELIKTQNLVFHSDVFGLLGIDSTTYYSHFPKESNEYKTIDDLLTENKIKMKNGLRRKWYQNDNATTQTILYKLIATKEERQAIAQNYTDVTSNGEKLEAIPLIDLTKTNDDLRTDDGDEADS